ncbi:bifunctional methylenetetrahydrofolate dehydrogenase/methenyltetrahydrofolate cyclohydrolase FolD [Tepidibacillus decaturensis]|uniref:Bifunctional protein FolD n=2 Tax=Tepidibacillus TaxID=1494427 RepID=A0A135L355_9BACI|nr:bifunctional methylenetetrahydrofolate dehydrogenase/methenyltetrahydrofolate cyclohydrolase FolD [Tepidibacillus decaturensis]KXG43293.1 bifunctional 5,10-methylene-tetrahydrofolate dehydrogenase/5,10-methylene-tetrahydrofolate cyclohydrolase [Tepidibacillus decaturensis]
MSAQIISGKEVAKSIREELKLEVETLKEQGITPGLSVILVGNDPASHSYVKGKAKGCEEVGIKSEVIYLEETISQETLLAEIERLNLDSNVHGILVQLPLPKHIEEDAIINAIDPKKDVDGFHPINVGKMMIGEDAYLPCTPHGIIELIKRTGTEIKGKHAVVIGRSNIVGKPVSILLLKEHATVTIAHSRTQNLKEITRQADILVVAIGKPQIITKDFVSPGTLVIDVGVNRLETGKLVGDVDFEGVSNVASYITPVPGGVGPMTITMLLKNTIEAAKK